MSATSVYRYAALIALIAVMAYLRAFFNDFVTLDDNQYIYENPFLGKFDWSFVQWAFSSLHTGNWHPLTWLSHGLDYALWALNPVGHHATSVILHGANAFLVVMLTYHLVLSGIEPLSPDDAGVHPDPGILARTTAAVTGLLFAVHPIHVESVAWISERKDVLYAFFYLLSVLAYRRYVAAGSSSSPDRTRFRSYFLALVLFSCALMSKPMAVTLPVVLLVLDWYPFRRMTRGTALFALIIEKIPFIACSAAMSAITMYAQYRSGSITALEIIPLSTRTVVAARSVLAYLGKMLIPSDLSPLYGYPAVVGLFSLRFGFFVPLVIVITALCFAYRKKSPIWLSVWGYYCISLFPVLGLIQMGMQPMADRYTYLPSLGPFLLVGLGIALIAGSSRRKHVQQAVTALTGAVLLLLIVLTVRQTGVWQNGIAMWTRIIEQGKDDQQIVDQAGRRASAYANSSAAYEGRGNTFARMGLYEQAVADYDVAVSLDPRSESIYNNRGFVHDLMGNTVQAFDDYTKAIAVNPRYAKAYANRCTVLQKLGRMQDAERDCRRAMELITEGR